MVITFHLICVRFNRSVKNTFKRVSNGEASEWSEDHTNSLTNESSKVIESTNRSSNCGNSQSWNTFSFVEEKVMRVEELSPPLDKENSERRKVYNTEGALFAVNEFQQVETNYSNNYCFESPQIPPIYTRVPECVKCGRPDSKSWAYDKAGNILCIYCSNQMYSGYSTAQNGLAIPISERFTQSTKKFDRLPPNFNVKNGTVCSNCQTSKTSLWRRAPEGDVVCNACGLYRKMHGRQRPLTMRKDSIQTRKRRSIKGISDDLSKHQQPNTSNKPLSGEIGTSLINDRDKLNISKDFQAAFGSQLNFQYHQLPYGEISHESFPFWHPEYTGIPQPVQQRFSDAFYSHYYQTPYLPTENGNNVLKMPPSVYQQPDNRFGLSK